MLGRAVAGAEITGGSRGPNPIFRAHTTPHARGHYRHITGRVLQVARASKGS